MLRARACNLLKASRRCQGFQTTAMSREAGSDDPKPQVGDAFTRERLFTFDDVLHFSQLCNNTNPIHLQHQWASSQGFPDCLVPQLLYAALFSSIIGSHFPGAVYVSQKLEFQRPVLVEELLLAKVEVSNIRVHRGKHRVIFETNCWIKREMSIAIAGTATALL